MRRVLALIAVTGVLASSAWLLLRTDLGCRRNEAAHD